MNHACLVLWCSKHNQASSSVLVTAITDATSHVSCLLPMVKCLQQILVCWMVHSGSRIIVVRLALKFSAIQLGLVDRVPCLVACAWEKKKKRQNRWSELVVIGAIYNIGANYSNRPWWQATTIFEPSSQDVCGKKLFKLSVKRNIEDTSSATTINLCT